jgi:hypothetical protein
MVAAIAMATTPPTTPPAIAPVFVELLEVVGAADGGGVDALVPLAAAEVAPVVSPARFEMLVTMIVVLTAVCVSCTLREWHGCRSIRSSVPELWFHPAEHRGNPSAPQLKAQKSLLVLVIVKENGIIPG